MFHIQSQFDYQSQWQAAYDNPDQFWLDIAQHYHWFDFPTKAANCDLKTGKIAWFEGGKTNLAYNCLDRHLATKGDQTAIIWEPNDPKDDHVAITYRELHAKVCQFSNLLVANGIQKGDRVCIYMPMILEGVIAMLACARIGAIHSVVFAGFSAKSLAGRMQDCGAKALITADILFRGEKQLALYDIAKEALAQSSEVEVLIGYQRAQHSVFDDNVIIWQEEVEKYATQHEAVPLDANDDLFILYTSGSTGTPKGILHHVGGYMVYAGYSFRNVFNYQEGDIHFCTADIGWITGHSYLTYGPLLNGGISVMFEGVPTYPDASRFWQMVEKHRVNIFYTAPTAIRALMQKGDDFVKGHDLSSLKTLGTVGEPINEEAWQWYFDKIGHGKCEIVDTWWQTETGGIMISSLAGVTDSKPSFAGLPLPGIVPLLLDHEGKEISEANVNGHLCFKQPWPSMAAGVWGNSEKFIDTYYARFAGYYLAGDGAFCDEKGLYRIIGRLDDVINVSGHRLGSAEIENAINSHEKVSESAVIGYPHPVKGEAICAFVIVGVGVKNIENEIIHIIQKEIGSIAKPDKIYLVQDLPKTRSGKIMRRILKKILAGESDLGDISTLVNPEIINILRECS